MTSTLSPLRVGRITASRLPAVLGLSPYQTRPGLMREMVREHFGDPSEFVEHPGIRWGREHEAAAVAEYEMTTGHWVDQAGPGQRTVLHPTCPYLAATPDGISSVGTVVEIKAPWRSRWMTLQERPDYEAQVRLQMEVCERDVGDLVIYRPGEPLVIARVVRDPAWLDTVLADCQDFWNEYRATIANEDLARPHREPLKDLMTGSDWALAAADWLELTHLIKQLTAQRKVVAAQLEALSPEKSARGAGIDLLRFSRRGVVDYPGALSAAGLTLDLDPFTTEPAQVVTIRRIGERKDRP